MTGSSKDIVRMSTESSSYRYMRITSDSGVSKHFGFGIKSVDIEIMTILAGECLCFCIYITIDDGDRLYLVLGLF